MSVDLIDDVNIGSGNGLVQRKHPAIAWTIDDPVHYHI